MVLKTPQLLVDELIKRNILDRSLVLEIEDEAREKEKDFGEILVSKKVVSDGDLLQIKSEVYKLPTIDLSNVKIDSEATEGITDYVVKLYKIIPFAKEDDILKVALVNPENIDALEALKFIATERKLRLEKFLINYKDFTSVSQGYRSFTSEVGKALESLNESAAAAAQETGPLELEGAEELARINSEAPVTRVVASIIKHAVETRTSDIHVEPFERNIRIRFRIDGVLQTVLKLPVKLLAAIATRIKILSDLKIDETRLAQDGRFSSRLNDRTVDFRVSTFPTREGEKVVMRILDPLTGNTQLEDLGIEGRAKRLLLENMNKPFGAILITGPTGSGKSTTLAAILRRMNSEDINIVTLEDPVEYYVDGVNQSQIHEEIGYTFASGLRHVLRQDPDVIMVGEIRDSETAKLATQASLTGHIVLSTLHTNDTLGVVPRLMDMEVEKYLLAPTLNLAVAQRLLRRLCDTCKVAKKATESEVKMFLAEIEEMSDEGKKELPPGTDFKNLQIFKAGEGCKECDNKAYKGRIGIFEVLEMSDELERIILSDLSEENLRKEAKRQGMITMFQDGVIKVIQGVTTIEELVPVAQSGEDENSYEQQVE